MVITEIIAVIYIYMFLIGHNLVGIQMTIFVKNCSTKCLYKQLHNCIKVQLYTIDNQNRK